MKSYYVYITTNKSKTVLYIGVTNDLERRMHEHRQRTHPGFASKYYCSRLIYFEDTDDINVAIAREKQLKGWRRSKKELLINKDNPNWVDLSFKWRIHKRYDEVPSTSLRSAQDDRS